MHGILTNEMNKPPKEDLARAESVQVSLETLGVFTPGGSVEGSAGSSFFGPLDFRTSS